MSLSIKAVIATRLEKAAVDNGFDQELPTLEGWLGFASTQVPLRLWLTVSEEGGFVAAFSQRHVAEALPEHGTVTTDPLPDGTTAGRRVDDIPALHHMVRRAFQLSKTLPDELLHRFETQTAALPRKTEAERLVVRRVGQNLFRDGQLDYWEGRCAVTELSQAGLLRASHIKPWAQCTTDAERLDVFNGLLLAPHLDAAFDSGLITFAEDRSMMLSPVLSARDVRTLGFDPAWCLRGLAEAHKRYLTWHRQKVFQAQPPASPGADD